MKIVDWISHCSPTALDSTNSMKARSSLPRWANTSARSQALIYNLSSWETKLRAIPQHITPAAWSMQLKAWHHLIPESEINVSAGIIYIIWLHLYKPVRSQINIFFLNYSYKQYVNMFEIRHSNVHDIKDKNIQLWKENLWYMNNIDREGMNATHGSWS